MVKETSLSVLTYVLAVIAESWFATILIGVAHGAYPPIPPLGFGVVIPLVVLFIGLVNGAEAVRVGIDRIKEEARRSDWH